MRTRRNAGLVLALLVIPVAACDSSSDGAVVTSQPAAGVALPCQPAGGGSSERDFAAPGPQPDAEEDEEATLIFMREEEKLARDVYLGMADEWGLSIFENIAESEQRHMDAVLELLDDRGIGDPVGDNPFGVFSDDSLQVLYEELIARGAESPDEALLVGATIEDLDIRDLRSAIAASSDGDVERVLGNLERASRNHLRAFSRQLDKHGIPYTPEYMDPGEYESVLASLSGRGRDRAGS